jgi:hypothetical protein
MDSPFEICDSDSDTHLADSADPGDLILPDPGHVPPEPSYDGDWVHPGIGEFLEERSNPSRPRPLSR